MQSKRVSVLKIGGLVSSIALMLVLAATPASAQPSQPSQNLPDAGSALPFVALGSALFVIVVGTAILLAARRASRDD